MDFSKLLNLASKNERKAHKQLATAKPVLSTKFSAPKKEVKEKKGVQSAAVRQFLEKKEQEEKEKAEAERRKKEELLKLRHEARHDRKAHAMASRTKDNLKVFNSEAPNKDDSTEDRMLTESEPDVDLKHLFTKHDRRVARLPSGAIPNMLDVLKERDRQRKLAREAAEKAALEKEAEMKAAEIVKTESEQSKRSHSLHNTNNRSSADSGYTSVSKDSHHSKAHKKPSRPPPLSFEQIIMLAQQKQAEPVTNPKTAEPTKPLNEPQRPMTQEEKERLQRRQTKEYQDWLNHGGPPPPGMTNVKRKHHRQLARSQPNSVRDRSLSSSSSSSSRSPSPALPEKKVTDNGRGNSYAAKTKLDSRHDDRDRIVSSKHNDLPTAGRTIFKNQPSSSFKSANASGASIRSADDSKMRSTSAGGNSSSSRPSSHSVSGSKPGSSRDACSRPTNRSDKETIPSKSSHHAEERQSGGNKKGSSSSLPDLSGELLERLKEQRRQMADRGDAVPSLADMLQSLLEKVKGDNESKGSNGTKSSHRPESSKPSYSSQSTRDPKQASTSKTDSSRHIPSKPSSSSSSKPMPSTSSLSGPKSSTSVAAAKPAGYVAVNETVITCDKSGQLDKRKDRPGEVQKKSKSTWDEIQERMQRNKPKPVPDTRPKKRPLEKYESSEDDDDDDDDDELEEDEEEEDDMDDFIDDGTEDNGHFDYSHYIRDLFGYDKRKYRDEPDDLRDMESSFSQVMREEALSAKLGLLEDLEDIKREEEENKRKLSKLKAKKQRLK